MLVVSISRTGFSQASFPSSDPSAVSESDLHIGRNVRTNELNIVRIPFGAIDP